MSVTNIIKSMTNRILPSTEIDVITCIEAVDTIQTDNDTSRSSLRQAKPTLLHLKPDNVLRHEDASVGKQFNIFEFQSILREACVLIPSGVVVSVFTNANAKSTKDQSNDPFCSFNLAEIGQIVHGLIGKKEDIPIRALMDVAVDLPSVFNFAAGLLLLTGLFPIPDTVANITGGLMANVFFFIAISVSVVGMPLREWREMIHVDSNVRTFKESLRMKAAAYESQKRTSGTSVLAKLGFRALPQTFVQQMQYIEQVIYSNSDALTKTDVEMLLLREVGTSYTSQTLDHILSLASQTNVSQKSEE